jgi:hypothetical protein
MRLVRQFPVYFFVFLINRTLVFDPSADVHTPLSSRLYSGYHHDAEE